MLHMADASCNYAAHTLLHSSSCAKPAACTLSDWSDQALLYAHSFMELNVHAGHGRMRNVMAILQRKDVALIVQ